MTPGILFVCVANSCRFQMAQALAQSMAGGRLQIWSAGLQAADREDRD